MKVKVLKEAGFEEALLGISFSYNSTPNKKVADRLAWKQGGHNKFLESIIVWLDVTAPRYWWQESDTYRHTSKQSQATIHTIQRRTLTEEDFVDGDIDPIILSRVNEIILEGNLLKIKRNLPEGFLQRREWRVDYKTLQNICMQRKGHKLPEWQLFISSLQEQLEHSYYVVRPE